VCACEHDDGHEPLARRHASVNLMDAGVNGRVGRSAVAKDLDANAVELAVRAHVRHMHTPYDLLLARGAERFDARREVASLVDESLKRWASRP